MTTDSAETPPVTFFDTCVRIGHSAAPDPPGNAMGVNDLLECMAKFNIMHAAVEHAVAREASPRLGHELLEKELAGHPNLRPAWHLMPDISPRIEKAYTDPAEYLEHRVALGRVDAKDFCNGRGDEACFAPVLEACEAIHLPVFIDFRTQGDPVTFDFSVCARYPRIPFVAEGFGGYPLHKLVWCLRRYPNLHVSIIGIHGFTLEAFLCETVGPERLIFGSNWPARSIGMSLGSVLFADVSPAVRQQIARGNFERLLEGIGVVS
ncbi:amidohydrolase family protein [bacterium]|nr:amidohydrolase family protein [bacterium]